MTGGITPGTNSAVWYTVSTGDAPTQLECAFYWALASAGSGAVVLHLGGNHRTHYPINGPLLYPSQGGQVEIIGSSRGDNGSSVAIEAQVAMETMILKPDAGTVQAAVYPRATGEAGAVPEIVPLTTIRSAATIAPTTRMFTLAGSASVSNIVPPDGLSGQQAPASISSLLQRCSSIPAAISQTPPLPRLDRSTVRVISAVNGSSISTARSGRA